jgi:hypothetical protein
MAETPGFFSREAGLARRRALDEYLNEAADYYLGPTGIPDRLRAVNEFFNPVAAMEDASTAAVRAADPERSVEERLEALAAAGVNTATFGLPALMGMMRAVPKDQALIQMLLGGGPDPSGATAGRAVIRRDETYRGEGPATVSESFAESDAPYAIRLTGMDQLEDMIESGLVRPRPGGYGPRNYSTIYFGETQTPDPMASVFTRPSPSKPVALVGNPRTLAAYEGGIPIDELERILVLQEDGQMLDMLDEILARNQARR